MMSSALNAQFWKDFEAHPEARHLIEDLLLMEPVASIRRNIAERIEFRMTNPHTYVLYDFHKVTDAASRTAESNPLSRWAVNSASFSAFFWPIISQMIPQAVRHPDKCGEFFNLSVSVMNKLMAEDSNLLDRGAFLRDCLVALREHETTEVCLSFAAP